MTNETLMHDSGESSNAEELNFITNPQFSALKNHYESVIRDMKNDEYLRQLGFEFSNLLIVFESCYQENKRKVNKIQELQTLNAIQAREIKNMNSVQGAIMRNLRNTVNNLQTNVDIANDQKRELLEEICDLKKTVDVQNKTIQVRSQSLEKLPSKNNKVDSGFKGTTSKTVLKHEAEESDVFFENKLAGNTEKGNDTAVTDVKVLRNNLEILVADLKLTREKITELKKDIRKKSVVIKDLSEDLDASEATLSEAQGKIDEIVTPLKLSKNRYKAESVEIRKKFEEVSEQLEKSTALCSELEENVSSKDSIIGELKAELFEMGLEKESACRRTEIFENHLVESQNSVEKLKNEVAFLKEEIESLKTKQVPKKTIEMPLHVDKVVDNVETRAQERTIESLKNHINLRDGKLRQTTEELRSTVEILQGLKENLSDANAQKVSLESEVQQMKERLKDKHGDLKKLKEKFYDNQKELTDVKREVQSRLKKCQQAVDKRNAIQSMCNQLKLMNDQQRHENAILEKRQRYLVKVLKEKDMEVEILASNRHIY